MHIRPGYGFKETRKKLPPAIQVQLDELLCSIASTLTRLLELNAPHQDFIIYLDSKHGLRFVFNNRDLFVVFVFY